MQTKYKLTPIRLTRVLMYLGVLISAPINPSYGSETAQNWPTAWANFMVTIHYYQKNFNGDPEEFKAYVNCFLPFAKVAGGRNEELFEKLEQDINSSEDPAKIIHDIDLLQAQPPGLTLAGFMQASSELLENLRTLIQNHTFGPDMKGMERFLSDYLLCSDQISTKAGKYLNAILLPDLKEYINTGGLGGEKIESDIHQLQKLLEEM